MPEMQMDPGKTARVAEYRKMNVTAPKGTVLFAGSSLMEHFPIEAFAAEMGVPFPVLNRGVSGFIIPELDACLEECVLQLRPRRLFINIGTNDLTREENTTASVVDAFEALLDRILAALPGLEVVLMAYYPVNPECAPNEWMRHALQVRSNARISEANALVKAMAARRGFTYIDVNAPLKDAQGRLRAEYTTEGMHIRPEGYRAIMPLLLPYITGDLPEKGGAPC